MGDRAGVAVHAVGLRFALGQCRQVNAGRGTGGADRAITSVDVALAAGAGFELHHLVGGHVPAQQRVDIAVLDALAAGRRHRVGVGSVLAVELQRVRVGLVEIAVQAERQGVGHRPTQLQADAFAATFGAVFGHQPIQVHRTGQVAGRALGDDVDHAAGGTGAIACRRRAAQHFDALDHFRRHPVGVTAGIALAAAPHAHGIACADALAIDQDQGVFRAHATQVDLAVVAVLARGAVAGQVDARHGPQQLGDVVGWRAPGDILGGDGRGTQCLARDLRGGDVHRVDIGGVGFGLGGQGAARQQGGDGKRQRAR